MFCDTVPQLHEPEHSPVKKIDNYLFRSADVLGSGNFSTVYSGVDQSNGKGVAVKVVKMSKVTSAIARKLLQNEIQVLTMINHPNVIKCHQVIQSANNFYMITEICEKGDLEKILKAKGKLDEREIACIANNISQGLIYLNSLEIIHRDIKIANIFISNDGTAKIADFGFAIKHSGILKDITIGSPIYMSPESLIKHEYSSKSDMWSFGVILYELFHGDTPLSKCKSEDQLKRTVLEPIKFSPLISHELKQLIKQCLNINFALRSSAYDVSKSAFLQKHFVEKQTKQINQFSVSYNSTTSSLEKSKINFYEIDYNAAVAILHYCRLVYKLHHRLRYPFLGHWLLNVSDALMLAKIDQKYLDKEKYNVLKEVINQYHTKYLKEQKDLRQQMSFDEVLWEVEKIKSVDFVRNHLHILIDETRLLRTCYFDKNISIFGTQGKSKSYLDSKKV